MSTQLNNSSDLDSLGRDLENKLKSVGVSLEDLILVLGHKLQKTRPEDKIINFENEIRAAKIRGDKWYETTQEVIDYFNPRGMKRGYFTFSGVNVCLEGKLDELLQTLEKTPEELSFGSGTLKRNPFASKSV